MDVYSVIPKAYDKKYLEEHSNIIFRERELIIEVEKGTTPEDTIFRFKVGDGIKPYNALSYSSSIYALFPKIILYNTDYSKGISLSLEGCAEECLP